MDIVEYYKRKEKEKHKDCIPKSDLHRIVESIKYTRDDASEPYSVRERCGYIVKDLEELLGKG